VRGERIKVVSKWNELWALETAKPKKKRKRPAAASVHPSGPSVQAARMSLAADFSIYLETLLLATCL
jgi:hypothetical protein